jgi:hypothetical protein
MLGFFQHFCQVSVVEILRFAQNDGYAVGRVVGDSGMPKECFFRYPEPYDV